VPVNGVGDGVGCTGLLPPSTLLAGLEPCGVPAEGEPPGNTIGPSPSGKPSTGMANASAIAAKSMEKSVLVVVGVSGPATNGATPLATSPVAAAHASPNGWVATCHWPTAVPAAAVAQWKMRVPPATAEGHSVSVICQLSRSCPSAWMSVELPAYTCSAPGSSAVIAIGPPPPITNPPAGPRV
jgi:hypothetical protein